MPLQQCSTSFINIVVNLVLILVANILFIQYFFVFSPADCVQPDGVYTRFHSPLLGRGEGGPSSDHTIHQIHQRAASLQDD